MVKDRSDEEITAFVARFRAAFASVISAVTGLNGTKHLTVRADLETPHQLAARVRQAALGGAS
jgi:hypothetical protein